MKGNVVGKNISKVDAITKVTGQAQYSTDLSIKNMVHMKAFRSPYPHALIQRIDIRQALAVPGIVRILTREDFPELKKHGLIFKDQIGLIGVGEKVRYLGDTLALVIGETERQVRKALRKIKVEYDPLPVITDPLEAMGQGVVKIHEDGNIACVHHLEKGDIEEGFIEADLIVHNEFKTQHLEHLPLQPEAGMAYMLEDGTICIRAATQWLHDTQIDVAHALGMPVEKVRIIQPAIGGAFGKREDVIVQLHLALAAKIVGRPIKTIYSREESIIATSKRHPMIFQFTTGVKEDGTITAWKAKVIGDTGAYASSGPAVIHKGLYHCTGPYNVPHVQGVAYTVYTNNTYSGAMRGFGVTQTAFACESQMDIIAEKLGMSPIELRMKNVYQVGSITSNGQVLLSSVGAKETMIKAIEAFKRQGGELR